MKPPYMGMPRSMVPPPPPAPPTLLPARGETDPGPVRAQTPALDRSRNARRGSGNPRRESPSDSDSVSSSASSGSGVSVHRPKSAYTSIVDAIIPVATFAGGITLATQLIIQCPNTRVQALLATSSQLFLNVPLVLITIHIVLYGKPDDAQVEEFREYRPFIIAQLVVAGVEMAIGFTLMSVAIYVADTSRTSVGVWGICLTGVSVGIAALTTLYPMSVRSRSKVWDLVPQEKVNLELYYNGNGGGKNEGVKEVVEVYKLYELQVKRVVVLWGVILSQLSFAGVLVGFGAYAASTAPIQFGCPSS